jgi:hypothetical protein
MITQQTQIKINLPLALKDFIESKAQKYDMPLAGYIKHLILKDVSDLEFPTFRISTDSENKAKKALTEKKKAIKITNISDYFKNL